VSCATGMGSAGSLPSAGGIGNVGERRGRGLVVGKGGSGVVKTKLLFSEISGFLTVNLRYQLGAQFRPIKTPYATATRRR